VESWYARVRRGLGAVLFGWMVLASYLLADGVCAAALPSDGGETAAVTAGAAPQAPAATPEQAAEPAAPAEDDDLEIKPVEPDFTVITIPTTLRLPRHKLVFRLTHRFSRPLGEGDFGDLAADAFGFDSGAQIGFEFRFGLFSGTQLGVYRTSDRTIQFFLNRDLVQQGRSPVGLAVLAGVEGRDNFSEQFAPEVGVSVSRKVGDRAAFYLFPAWVGNTNLGPSGDDYTILLGVGARVRISSGAYLVGEWMPRLAGFKGHNAEQPLERADDHVSFGIEGRVGGHVFQLNFSRTLQTMFAPLARGMAPGSGDWFLGFNLSRKFW
jgi:Membrane bound beta barrel domain (DUF5777)